MYWFQLFILGAPYNPGPPMGGGWGRYVIFSYEISKVHEKPCNSNSGGKQKTVRVSRSSSYWDWLNIQFAMLTIDSY